MIGAPGDQNPFFSVGHKKSLGQKVYDRLLDLIITRKITPGFVLQERIISEMLDVSRTPAREALYRLETEGFLVRGAGRTMVVKEISVRDFVEILHIRRVLESESVRLAVGRIPDEELAQLATDIEGLLKKSNPAVSDDWVLDDRFHGLVAQYSGSAMLVKTTFDLRMKTRVFTMERIPERFTVGHEEHLVMIEHMRRHDVSTSRKLIEAHIDNVKDSIIKKLDSISAA